MVYSLTFQYYILAQYKKNIYCVPINWQDKLAPCHKWAETGLRRQEDDTINMLKSGEEKIYCLAILTANSEYGRPLKLSRCENTNIKINSINHSKRR